MKDEFPGFGAKEWIEFYESLSAEVPVEKLRLKLTDEGKRLYEEELKGLKEDRKICPQIKYEINYTDFE